MRCCSKILRCVIPELRTRQGPLCQLTNLPKIPRRLNTFSTICNLRQQSNDAQVNLTDVSSATSDAPLRTHRQLKSHLTSQSVPVTCAGLVRSVRKQRRVAFAAVSDGSTLSGFQAVLSPEDAKDIQNGSYVKLKGTWQPSQGKGQTHELQVEKVLFHGTSDPAVSPIQKQAMSVDHLRAYPHLRLRIPLYALMARTRAFVYGRAHQFYGGSDTTDTDNTHSDEAIYVQPPLITSSDCEGAGETFTISPKVKSIVKESVQGEKQHYFRTQKYLTVSSQLHLEAFSAELGDVWTLSPTFRAEESDTARHLSEFWMLESEFRNIDNLRDLMEKVERLIKSIARGVAQSTLGQEWLSYHASTEGEKRVDLMSRWEALTIAKWKTITYMDAISALEDAAASSPDLFEYAPTWENGLQLEHERWVTEHLAQNQPIFITHYPKAQKPFYMLDSKSQADSKAIVSCFDLLLPDGICEVAGGSLRHHDLKELIESMREKGLLKGSKAPDTQVSDAEIYPFLCSGESLNTMEWYADLRRYGTSPHGGFGVGMDRLLMYLTGISHVRDIVPFPRTFGTALC